MYTIKGENGIEITVNANFKTQEEARSAMDVATGEGLLGKLNQSDEKIDGRTKAAKSARESQ